MCDNQALSDAQPVSKTILRSASGVSRLRLGCAGDLSDLLMAHASWFTYAGMTRIYKHYHLALRHPAIRSQAASFSSYAGNHKPRLAAWSSLSGSEVVQGFEDGKHLWCVEHTLISWCS